MNFYIFLFFMEQKLEKCSFWHGNAQNKINSKPKCTCDGTWLHTRISKMYFFIVKKIKNIKNSAAVQAMAHISLNQILCDGGFNMNVQSFIATRMKS